MSEKGREYSHDTSPFEVMYDHGFHGYVSDAREILPDDWGTRYGTGPEAMAMALTYYVGFQDYTQVEVAAEYDSSINSLRRVYTKLKDDHGLPE